MEATPENLNMIRGILHSQLAESIMKRLFLEFKKDPNFKATMEKIASGDLKVKLPGLSFNAICDESRASRTTVHATLTTLLKRFTVITNEKDYVQTTPGPRLAIVYSLRPETVNVMLFLFPALAEESVPG
jgi:hypothetical protein